MVAFRRRHGQRTELAVGTGPDDAVERAPPDRLRELPARSWWAVLRRTVAEFNDDAPSDRAAALTYYAIQAIFPALLVLVSLLGVVGKSATTAVLDNVEQLTPGSARDVARDAVNGIRDSGGTGGVVALVGLAGAVGTDRGRCLVVREMAGPGPLRHPDDRAVVLVGAERASSSSWSGRAASCLGPVVPPAEPPQGPASHPRSAGRPACRPPSRRTTPRRAVDADTDLDITVGTVLGVFSGRAAT
nr:YhjD/YihY/BrkB family envelope integrity protein [Frankia sp. AgPm24]